MTEFHRLNTGFVLWFHPSNSSDWTIESYKNLYEFSTIEDYIKLNNSWEKCLPSLEKSMFFLMRKKNIP